MPDPSEWWLAYSSLEEQRRLIAVDAFSPETIERFLSIKGNGPRRLRRSQRGAIETWRFVRGSRKALETGDINNMFKFQHSFKWRFQDRG